MSDDLLLLKELGRRLRLARKERKLTQEKLEVLSGISERTISRIENGLHNPSFALLYPLVRALNMPADRLFYDDVSQHQHELALLERNYSASNAAGRKIILEISSMVARIEHEAEQDK